MKILKISLRVVALLLFVSCSPQSKESYLERYKDFIENTGNNSLNYTEKEWQEADEKYQKYTGIWHDKFKEEFTWKEEILLSKYKFQYNFFKAEYHSKDFFNSYIEANYESLKKQIKYYYDNEMNDDIEKMLKTAKKAGKESYEIIEGILNDLKNKK